MIHAIGAAVPAVHDSVFVAWNAEVSGNVDLAVDASVWFSAVIRGDVGRIEIGEGTNVQDGSVVHVDDEDTCRIGRGVTVGHKALLHSCVVGDGCLVGMGAIILSGAEIGEASMVAAGSLVTGGKRFPPRSMIMGSPAKRVRDLTEGEIADIAENSRRYVELARDARVSYRELS